MLRALTSYFFGGIQDETPEAPIECETREVNDWLVVNLPDQNKDNINLNEEDDTYEIDDGDIRNEIDDDEDDAVEVDASDVDEMDASDEEEEILMSLSFLMMPPVECDSLYADLILEQYPVSHWDLPAPPQWDNRQLMGIKATAQDFLDFVMFPVHPPKPRPCERYRQPNEALCEFLKGGRIEKRGQRNDIVSEYERVNAQAIELAPPPTYSKNYVNHRHPEKLLSHDILQRIKELEPEQQAAQRSAKKILTRGQLNRQNKNYMYETSSKKNRRSKLQRNHSGANNNRKC